MRMVIGLRPMKKVTSISNQFVIDRERARDTEFAVQHNPEKSKKASRIAHKTMAGYTPAIANVYSMEL